MRFSSFGATGALAVGLLSTAALANSTGINGMSGKEGATCNSCHMGGTAPTVELSGPTSLAAGATGQYTLIIRGGAAKVGGLNVAVNNAGATLQPGAGMRKLGSELTHSTSKAFSGNEVRFDFSLVAPSTAGTLKLFGAGNSSNGDGSELTGDRAAATTLDVTVTGTSQGGGTGNGNGENDEAEGGCSATGGAPLLFPLLAASMLLTRRRRR